MFTTESGWKCVACGSTDLCYGDFGSHRGTWFYPSGASRWTGGKRVLAAACLGCGMIWPFLTEKDRARLAEERARPTP